MRIRVLCSYSSNAMLIKRLIFLAFVLIFTTVIAVSAVTVRAVKNAVVTDKQESVKTVIVDAGHGGFDGGAVVCKYVEKDINLKISLNLCDMLRLDGYNVIMTRSDDSSTESEASGTISARKKSDMRNRLAIMKNNINSIFVSIHMNKYDTSSPHGAQIFYASKVDGSMELAECVMQRIIKNVQHNNNRLIKKNYDSTFILKNAPVPAIIAECGFMSNPGELNNLLNEDYQKKLAFAIKCGIEDYYN